MKVAIMQPYFFPYIGYFQLINAVDIFIFYDDVNFIKQGWINRNRILINGKPHYITLSLHQASSFKKINEIEINLNKSEKILKTIYLSYKKAPYFNLVYPIVESTFDFQDLNLARFVANSVIQVLKYLNIEKKIFFSSELGIGKDLKGEARVINICKYFNAKTYINAIGGMSLYSKENFLKEGIDLKFLKSREIIYNQFNENFVPFLSMIDVLMFNSKDMIKKFLGEYDLL